MSTSSDDSDRTAEHLGGQREPPSKWHVSLGVAVTYVVMAVACGVLGGIVTAGWEMTRGAFSESDFSKGGVYLTALTAFLVAIQIWIANEQKRIADEQTAIAKTQTTILRNQDALLRRTEDLSLKSVASDDNTYTFTATRFRLPGECQVDVPLTIVNRGRSIRGVTVFCWLLEYDDEVAPRMVSPGWTQGNSEYLEDSETGRYYNKTLFSRQFADLLLPGHNSEVELAPRLTLSVESKSKTYYFLVQFLSENGYFPAAGPQRVRFMMGFHDVPDEDAEEAVRGNGA